MGDAKDRHAVRVVYDSYCEFCRGITRIMKKFDSLNLVRLVAASDFSQLSDHLNMLDLDSVMAIDSAGRCFRSSHAISRVIIRMPLLFPLFPVLLVFQLLGISEMVYEFIAQRRYSLPSRLLAFLNR
ncbi:MAG TPA: DCC1-like thiol-disulfide oxidoreductase family protein [Thermoplasmataceae archaeon]|nr:DUF393 domain-containing protein [Thermoplasmatales archaeon AK]HLH86274.1 DCC1-like thiol-disulfide oxidoreductase family protein [Thermoplasmataceae archaeon]